MVSHLSTRTVPCTSILADLDLTAAYIVSTLHRPYKAKVTTEAQTEG
jgi:hypothetical protein